MRVFLAIVLCCFAVRDAQGSHREPKRHDRFSSNGRYKLDFDPESNRHSVYAFDNRTVPIWSFESDDFWPDGTDESDGGLFVANDGMSVAGRCWVPMDNKPAGYRTFDGVAVWGPLGNVETHRVSQLTWRINFVDFPLQLVWMVVNPSAQHRGNGFSRAGETLYVTRLAPRSLAISIKSGEIESWWPNPAYFALFTFVYGPPIWTVARFLTPYVRGRQRPNVEAKQRQPFIIRHFAKILVAMNSMAAVFAIVLDGAFIDYERDSANLFMLSQAFSIVLIFVAIAFSIAAFFSSSRRIDLLGPWCAAMSAIAIQAISILGRI
jgi:hypothetical protein